MKTPMTQTFSAKTIDNILVMDLDGMPTLIDTGAMISLALQSPVSFMGQKHCLADGRRIIGNLQSPSEAIRVAKALFGNPILGNYDIAISLGKSEILFTDGYLELPETHTMPMSEGAFFKIPVIEMELNGRKLRAAFDTCSSISFARRRLIDGCDFVRQEDGVFPDGEAAFDASIHSVPARLNGQAVMLKCASLDGSPFEEKVKSIGQVDMLLGADVLVHFDCVLSHRRGLIAFISAKC
jgi:hypothetical protein